MNTILKRSIISVAVLAMMASFALVFTHEAVASGEKKVSLTWLATPVGSDGYNFASALADIIKKNHPGMRASCVETMGGVEGMKMMSDMASDKRQLHMATGVGAILNLARLGKGPFGKAGKIDGWRVLFTMYNVTPHIMTLDPKIKTGYDLVGKRVGFPPRQHGLAKDGAFLLGNVWGIEDKVKKVHMPMDLQKDALLDGTVDAVCAGGMYLSENEFKVSPNNEVILAARKNVYFIGVDQKDGDKTKEKFPTATLTWAPIKAGALRPGYPAKDWGILIQANTAYVWQDMPLERAYEITKVCAENADKVKGYFAQGKAFAPGNMVLNCWGQKWYHPGALKYYQEVGLKPSGTVN